MKRFRWLEISWGKTSLSSVADMMLRSEYLSNSTSGFRLEEIRNDEIIGKFIERRKIIDEIKDPFGTPMSFTREIFEVIKFRLTKQFPELELQDPPRRFSTFTTKLAECTNFNISIQPLKINTKLWAEGIEQKFGTTTVVAVTSSSFPVGDSTVARFSIGGITDVRQHIKYFSINKNNEPHWDKAKLKSVIKGQVSEYEISCRGTVSFLKGQDEDLIQVLRRNLSLAIRSKPA
jgi:hypothetical protein